MRRPRVSPMLGVFAAFEFKYQLRSTMFFVTAAIFSAFTFAFVTVSEMSKAIAGVAHVNSPHAISTLIASMASLAIFIPVVFLASVVMRDRGLDTEALFFSRPVTEFDYLAGRFIGAFAVCCVVLLVAPLAVLAGSFAPWLDPETVGPLRPFDYVYNYLVFGVANLLIPGALLFTVANLTRSTMATYTATVLFFVAYFAGSAFATEAEYRLFRLSRDHPLLVAARAQHAARSDGGPASLESFDLARPCRRAAGLQRGGIFVSRPYGKAAAQAR
jgi:ABC-2 type transport system permease protein